MRLIQWSSKALLALSLLVCLTPRLAAQESGLQAAIRLVSEGRLQEALEAAQGEAEPLARAQAELHVLHHGGLLDDALESGLRGLEIDPEDAWLLERSAYIALSLGAGELARDLSERLRGLSTAGDWERNSWMLEEALALTRQRDLEASALRRSRLAVLTGTLLSLAFLFVAWRGLKLEQV